MRYDEAVVEGDAHEFRADDADGRERVGLRSAGRRRAGCKCAVRPQMGREPARRRDAAAQAPRRPHQPQLPQLHGDVSVLCRGGSHRRGGRRPRCADPVGIGCVYRGARRVHRALHLGSPADPLAVLERRRFRHARSLRGAFRAALTGADALALPPPRTPALRRGKRGVEGVLLAVLIAHRLFAPDGILIGGVVLGVLGAANRSYRALNKPYCHSSMTLLLSRHGQAAQPVCLFH